MNFDKGNEKHSLKALITVKRKRSCIDLKTTLFKHLRQCLLTLKKGGMRVGSRGSHPILEWGVGFPLPWGRDGKTPGRVRVLP